MTTPTIRPTAVDAGLPSSLPVLPVSRRPLVLPDRTLEDVLARPVPSIPRRSARRVEVSVIVVTLDNIVLTRMTLESLLSNTTEPPYEVIVVDNGSVDGSAEYLRDLATRNPPVRVVFNDENRGFASATNQGLRLARGTVLVLLNNDTLVPPGWLSGLVAHLADGTVGVVGPVTNRCGNEAQIETPYTTYGEFLAFAARRRRCPPKLFEIPVAEMFCAAFRRDVFEAVGELDERFLVGLFEDDDYARRVRRAGFRVACAQDVFVHHFGEGSFGWLVSSGEYALLFEANRRRFEEKWGDTWEAHGRRRDPEYARVRVGVTEAVSRFVSAGSVVLVVSRGDEALVDLPGCEGWHFPRTSDGTYAGHYPADDRDAIAQLEHSRRMGARYLLVPAPSSWWLEHYRGFHDHLAAHYQQLEPTPGVAAVYLMADRTREARERSREVAR